MGPLVTDHHRLHPEGCWLVRDGVVLASIEVASGVRGRAKGLLGRDGIDGTILLDPCRSIHTVGMRFDIDVAFCTRDLEVVKVLTVVRNRVALAWSALGSPHTLNTLT